MPEPFAPGSSIGHYQIVEPLGAGGMGQVFLATDTRLGRKVALKALLPGAETDPDRLQRFLQEGRIASSLSHPNIVSLHEAGEAAGVRYMALEYVEGQSLSKLIENGPLALPETVSVAHQAAAALAAAHQQGIFHRDIKPSNMILGPHGHLKLLDFGLAKAGVEAGSNAETQLLTSVGTLLGTVRYMSPEQALGRPVDARSDLFSLGVVLYEMITGRAPFAGANSQETIAHILNSQPPAIARFNYETPEALERIVRKCLEKDRERRYASARDLLVDLEAVEREMDAKTASSALPAGTEITAAIVDDEELARGLMREYLSTIPGVRVVAECANGFQAVKAVADHQPDVVFLDVQMPKLDGFEVLELIADDIAVVFVTAFDTYAMRAFDAHAVDYLLKPFSLDRLQTAVERVRQRLGQRSETGGGIPRPPAAELSNAARPPDQFLQRIVVRDGPKVHILSVSQLDYAEAQDDYISLHSDGKSFLKQQTISSLEAALDPKQFVRIHRSVVVNIERIARIEPVTKDSRLTILHDGTRLPLSRSGYERLNALLDER